MPDTLTIPWTASEILEATHGQRLCGQLERAFTGIGIDSRQITAGQLFVAIKGETHDGHAFVPDVLQKKVQGLLIAQDRVPEMPVDQWRTQGIVGLAVDNTVTALGHLAHFNRRRAAVSVVAITGSNGKTTTRSMITTVVSQKHTTLATTGNLNNEIGLPLTLFRLSPDHRWAVLELGMNHPGEIGRLGRICEPDIGVITNIGPAHLEGLKSMEGVMQAKGELLQTLASNGLAILNADDPYLLQLAERCDRPVLFFGLSDRARVRAVNIVTRAAGITFTLVLPGAEVPVELQTHGRFMVGNALAAAAVGHQIGLSAQSIKSGLEAFRPVTGRLNICQTPTGVNLIDDTYNANPGSMRAAIETLQVLKGNHQGVLVAGDMLELGTQAKRLHMEIGAWAADHAIDRLYITGAFAPQVAAGAQDQGLAAAAIYIGSKQDILRALRAQLQPGDWVLVKGSRGMRMETIVQGLLAQRADQAAPGQTGS